MRLTAMSACVLHVLSIAFGLLVPAAIAPAFQSSAPEAPSALTVYLSAGGGDDRNSGLSPSFAKRTYQAASELLMSARGGEPRLIIIDWTGPLGTTTPGSLDWAHGRDADHPAVLHYVGSAPINTGNKGFIDATCFPSRPGANVVIRGLKIRPATYDGLNGSPMGISLVGPWENVRIEDCDITGYFVGLAIQGVASGYARGITVRNCVVADSWTQDSGGQPQGLIIGLTRNVVIEGNVFDHNGWREVSPIVTGTIFRHNVYINPENTSGVLVRNNISARAAANGLRSAGEICEDNIILRCPAGIAAGPSTKLIRGNVILDSRDISPSLPLGHGIGLSGTADCEVVGNVIAHRSSPSTWNLSAISLDHCGELNIHHNHIYDWAGTGDFGAAALSYTGFQSGTLAFWNNLIQMPRGGRLAWGENSDLRPAFAGNRWYGVGAWLFSDPVLAPGVWMNWPQRQSVVFAPADSFLPAMPVPTVEQFMLEMGRAGGLEGYMAAARAREPWVWQLRNYVLARSGAVPNP